MDLANLSTIKKVLQEERIFAKKRLGQKFLVDVVVLSDIIKAADLKEDDQILEIGPGLGALSQALIEAVPQGLVLAVEKDRDMVEWLRKFFKNKKNFKVVVDNILTIQLDKLIQFPYKLIANLPYNITSPVIKKFLLGGQDGQYRPESITIMVQKEVAERLAAKTGHRARGLLTVFVELFGGAELVRAVPATSFYPQPKVESAIVHIKVIKPRVEPLSFLKLLKAGFSNKRRMLHNSLAGSWHMSTNEVKKILKKVRIDSNKRAEELRLEEWLALYYHISHNIQSITQ